MKRLDLTLPSAEENLALDEALLLGAEDSGPAPVLRLWEWPRPAVVLGSAGVIAADVDEASCAADGVPILRRSSGGGTVLLGAGCLCFAVIVPYSLHPAFDTIHGSYRWVLERVGLAVPGSVLAGICDLTLEGLKYSGNAQQRKRDHLLHHGTILHSFDLASVGRYLKQPPRQPEYRAGRPHDGFVRNVGISADALRAALALAFGADDPLTAWPAEGVARLVAEKYGQESWQRRR